MPPASTIPAPRSTRPTVTASSPLARVLGYLGGLGILAAATLAAPLGGRWRSLGSAVFARFDELLCRGLVLVGLIHIGFGSFLSMQAYFGATFTAASGAVVALGLLRNVAPLLTGFTMAGYAAARITAEYSAGGLDPELIDPADLDDPAASFELDSDAGAGRATFVRLAAAMASGPLLVFWGATVGSVIGALVCSVMLGVPTSIYFGLARQMLRLEDVLGVIVKGMLYMGVSTLIACHEGRRAHQRGPRAPGAPAAFRAMVLSMLAILTINLSWFQVVYLSGSPYGPAVGGIEP